MTIQTSIIVRFNKTTRQDALHAARREIFSKPGILAATCSQQFPFLVIVDYDAEKVSSQHILSTSRSQQDNAMLIGL